MKNIAQIRAEKDADYLAMLEHYIREEEDDGNRIGFQIPAHRATKTVLAALADAGYEVTPGGIGYLITWPTEGGNE